MPITNGTYTAKATGQCVLGTSKQKGTPFIEFYFEITKGDNKGGKVRWSGYFTEATSERTIQALQFCGWQGEDLAEFSDGNLHGLDTNEVDVVVELEEYENDQGEKRTSPRVQWVNRSGGYLNTDAAMNVAAAQTFSERMRGLVMKMKEKNPNKGDGTDFKFGANASAPPSGTAPVAGTPGAKAF